jgi:UDP-N-acetylglucosamine 2-epimerase (non-hydrolysing)
MASLVFVAGARPNFMKIAPVLRALAAAAPDVDATLVHTGQHYDKTMSDIFFRQLGIREPDVYLQVGSGTHGAQTARIMMTFEQYLMALDTPPRGVVVVGDVNSTVGCALVAVKLGIPVAHVEAGLRSFDRTMPEEINRLVTDAISDVLLVSEPAGLANLEREGIPADKVHYVGNVMIDTLVHQLPEARATRTADKLGVAGNDYALVTLHRPSNVDDKPRLTDVAAFLSRLGAAMPTMFPVHPRTDNKLREFGLRDELDAAPGVRLLEPLGYRENLDLMAGARVVVSDSGGIQEETTYLGVPCITLRANTERPVTETTGTNTVVGDDLDRAWAAVEDILAGRYKSGGPVEGWDGRAAERVVAALCAAWLPARNPT